MLEIVIANTAEAFADLLDRIDPAADRTTHELDLAGRVLLWGGSEKIVITPCAVDGYLIQSTMHLMNLQRLDVWQPNRSTLRLCADILQDEELLSRLRSESERATSFLVRPYAITPEFCALSEHLHWGSYRAALKVAQALDSKAGFRQAFENSQITLPNGSICSTLEATAAAVHAFAKRGQQAVVKVHNGESGWGMRLLNPPEERLEPLAECVAAIGSLFDSDPIWAAGPYIVEEFVSHDRSITNFSPSGEATIDDSGLHFDYLCSQIVDGDGEFSGVCIGAEIENSCHAEEIQRQTLLVGKALQAGSYRGTYDVDFIVSSEGVLFAVESNVRHTGGTHVFSAAHRLFGARWHEHTFVSNDAIRYGAYPLPAIDILNRLRKRLLKGGDDEGVIISFISAQRPIVGLIGVGLDREGAVRQLIDARRILSKSAH